MFEYYMTGRQSGIVTLFYIAVPGNKLQRISLYSVCIHLTGIRPGNYDIFFLSDSCFQSRYPIIRYLYNSELSFHLCFTSRYHPVRSLTDFGRKVGVA